MGALTFLVARCYLYAYSRAHFALQCPTVSAAFRRRAAEIPKVKPGLRAFPRRKRLPQSDMWNERELAPARFLSHRSSSRWIALLP